MLFDKIQKNMNKYAYFFKENKNENNREVQANFEFNE